MTYDKIQTLFMRDEHNIIIPSKLTLPEFEYLRYNLWEATEKIDGCLWYGTRIQMADGSIKLIKDVRQGDLVVGYDVDTNQVKVVEVQGVARQPAAGTWVKVKVTHNGLCKGNSFGNIICTFDHRVWTTNGYKEAHELVPGDKVLSIRNDLTLTPIQKSILTGKMLGDGTLCVRENEFVNTASVQFGHAEEQMTLWTLRGLQEIAGNTSTRESGYGSTVYVGRTKNFPCIYNEFADWITEDEGKQVPEDIFLDPISIAFWYMDDGALSHAEGQEDRVRFSTNAFNNDSCKHLQRELLKFGIESTVANYKGNTICLDSESSEKLLLLIAPYICKEYQYKLPERYRSTIPFIPTLAPNQFHRLIVEQEVLEVTREERSYVRWDIQTETHNFFTTTCLVHNTNIRTELSKTEDGINHEFKGRTDAAVIPNHLLERLHEIFDNVQWEEIFPDMTENTNITLFGEGYGKKIQACGSRYIKEGVDFILFDIRVNEWWLTREACEEIASKLGIKIVPFIGFMDIPTAIQYVRDGFKSNISEDKELDAEGLVLKTPYGLRFRNGSRIITKIKTCDFTKYKNKYGDEEVEQFINPYLLP